MMSKEKKVLNELMKEGVIPRDDLFQVTESQLKAYINEYSLFSSKRKNNFNFRYARKLAGLSLLKENLRRGAKPKDLKAGLVYIIENPVFPNHVKVGMTIDLNGRLRSYQTYDPLQRFSVKHYDFVLDRRQTERLMLTSHGVDIENGEWIVKGNELEVLRKCGDGINIK